MIVRFGRIRTIRYNSKDTLTRLRMIPNPIYYGSLLHDQRDVMISKIKKNPVEAATWYVHIFLKGPNSKAIKIINEYCN